MHIRRRRAIVVVVLLGAALAGVALFIRAQLRVLPDNESAKRCGDLKMVILAHSCHGSKITISYGLQWLDVPTRIPVVFMRDFATLSVNFFGRDQRRLKKTEGFADEGLADLGDFFCRKTPVFRGENEFDVPENAVYFSIAIGHFETNPIPILRDSDGS